MVYLPCAVDDYVRRVAGNINLKWIKLEPDRRGFKIIARESIQVLIAAGGEDLRAVRLHFY